jgi:hypothetical protein
VHHAATNVDGRDGDLDLLPLWAIVGTQLTVHILALLALALIGWHIFSKLTANPCSPAFCPSSTSTGPSHCPCCACPGSSSPSSSWHKCTTASMT